MWADVVLPQSAFLASLPAFDGFGGGFVAGVGGVAVVQGPAANAGASGFEVETAQHFAGTGAVGGGWFGGQELAEQGGNFGGPVWVMVAAGDPRGPGVGL